MKQAYTKRLDALEQQAQPTFQRFEIWIGGEEEGTLERPSGEVLTVEQFERRYPDARSLDGPSPTPYAPM